MRFVVRQYGMTLLEVMIALSIFAVAAMSILNSVAVQIHHLPEVEDQTIADQISLIKAKQVSSSIHMDDMDGDPAAKINDGFTRSSKRHKSISETFGGDSINHPMSLRRHYIRSA